MHQIRVVQSTQEVKDFYSVLDLVYQNDENYIYPMENDVENVFNSEKNETFEKGECIRFVLYNEKGITEGRIAAFYSKDSKDKLNGGCGFLNA